MWWGRNGSLPGALLVVVVAVLAAACSDASSQSGKKSNGVISAVGAENQYSSVIAQIGGSYVHVTAIMSNPNTDPHTFEASPSVAQAVSSARLVVQNGVGYDSFMNTIEAGSASATRKVVEAQAVLGLPISTPNPHLWYSPKTMPVVAERIAKDLSALDPAHAAYFQQRLAAFNRSLTPWLQAIAHFKATYPGTPVATSEPVADYMLEAAGARNLTPFPFQADIMNGVDPAPEDITLQNDLFARHKVKVFLYNAQVTDSLTQSLLGIAKNNGVPVVAVYETMPPGFDYQSWMLAEVRALEKAVANKISTDRL